MDQEHFAYLLLCADGSYYAGYTNNLEARLEKHNSGKGAKYTAGRIPVTLVYHEVFTEKGDALRRERAFKKLRRRQKERLIAGSQGSGRLAAD